MSLVLHGVIHVSCATSGATCDTVGFIYATCVTLGVARARLADDGFTSLLSFHSRSKIS